MEVDGTIPGMAIAAGPGTVETLGTAGITRAGAGATGGRILSSLFTCMTVGATSFNLDIGRGNPGWKTTPRRTVSVFPTLTLKR